MSFSVNSTFWSSLIIWDFGDWKTFGVENMCYIAKDKYPEDILLMSNVPNKIVDIPYNSPDDLKQLIEWIFRFFIETNSNIEHYNKTYRDMILVIDEAHNYFPQDWSVLSSDKELLQKLRVILTQCRKRNLKLYLCTQRAKTVNINVRRYTDYIYMFVMQRYLENEYLKKNTLEVYKCWWWVADLLWEDWVSWATFEDLQKDKVDTLTMEYNTIFKQWIYKLKHKNRNLWNEKYLTQYICWLPWNYLNVSDYDEFKKKLEFWKTVDERKYKSVYNQDWLNILNPKMINFYMNKQERENAKFRLY